MIMKYTQTKFQIFLLSIKRDFHVKKKVNEKSVFSLHSIVILSPIGPFFYDLCH